MPAIPTRGLLRRLAVLAAAACWGGGALAADVLEGQAVVIHAGFRSDGGESDVRSVRFSVDGVDVTDRSEVGALRVAYVPPAPLAPGSHVARVTVTDQLGRTFEKEWTFEVTKAPAPQVVAFFTDALRIELDALPRVVRARGVDVAGTTQPGAQVELRLDDGAPVRAIADATGRFTARVDMEPGSHVLVASAEDLATGETGEDVEVRIDREETQVVSRGPASRPLPGIPLPKPFAKPVQRPDVIPRELPDPTTPPPAAERPRTTTPAPIGRDVERPEIEPGELPDPTTPPPAAERPRTTPPAPVGREVERPDVEPGDVTPVPRGEVVITKPEEGDALRNGRVTVLGRAPAGWSVAVLVDDETAGEDVANPAGHFTVPQVELSGGEHELVAEATSPDGATMLRSKPVHVTVDARFDLGPAASVTLTSPARASVVARGEVQRIEGTAWDGAEIEVERNGVVAARAIAGTGGRFVLDLPLEPGMNLVTIEAASFDDDRMARSPQLSITSRSSLRRAPPRAIDPWQPPIGAPVSRPTLPGEVRPRVR